MLSFVTLKNLESYNADVKTAQDWVIMTLRLDILIAIILAEVCCYPQ